MTERLDPTAGLRLEPRPFVCAVIPIEPHWIDYNGHLNMAYYNVLFDRSLDEFFDMIGTGHDYLKTRNNSTRSSGRVVHSNAPPPHSLATSPNVCDCAATSASLPWNSSNSSGVSGSDSLE